MENVELYEKFNAIMADHVAVQVRTLLDSFKMVISRVFKI